MKRLFHEKYVNFNPAKIAIVKSCFWISQFQFTYYIISRTVSKEFFNSLLMKLNLYLIGFFAPIGSGHPLV